MYSAYFISLKMSKYVREGYNIFYDLAMDARSPPHRIRVKMMDFVTDITNCFPDMFSPFSAFSN